FGAYHSGIEWGWWSGPTACSATGELETNAMSLLESLGKTRAPSCTEAALRIFGISLAGYNFLISAALAAIAGIGGMKARKAG
ncbi:MAG: disulfide bond formation protein B, partial [Halocynthiibacter sp.]